MRLSVVIVNWNTTGLLQALLQSLRRYPPQSDYEILVVDNASDDFDPKALRLEFPNVKLIVNSFNAGYALGNNQAFESAQGEYLLLLNPDTEVTNGALDFLVNFMDTHSDAAAVGAKLLRPDGSVDRSLRSFPYPGPIAWEYTGLSKIFPNSKTFAAYRMTYFGYNEIAEVDQPMGSCLMLRRSVIEEIGSFDTDFPIFFNEVDWLYRAKEAGYKVFFVPDAVVIHHGGSSTRQVNRRKMMRESHDSLLKFYEKHFRGRMSAPAYFFATACIKLSAKIRCSKKSNSSIPC